MRRGALERERILLTTTSVELNMLLHYFLGHTSTQISGELWLSIILWDIVTTPVGSLFHGCTQGRFVGIH